MFLGSNLYFEEEDILMLGRSGLYRLQAALVCRVRATIKRSVAPEEIAVTMDPDWLTATRCTRRDDILQNAKKTSTGSSPMAQEVRPPGRPHFHAFLAIVPLVEEISFIEAVAQKQIVCGKKHVSFSSVLCKHSGECGTDQQTTTHTSASFACFVI